MDGIDVASSTGKGVGGRNDGTISETALAVRITEWFVRSSVVSRNTAGNAKRKIGRFTMMRAISNPEVASRVQHVTACLGASPTARRQGRLIGGAQTYRESTT